MVDITANIEAIDKNLTETLEEVKEEATKAKESLDQLDESIKDVSESASTAADRVKEAGDELNNISGDAVGAMKALSSTDNKAEDLTISSEELAVAIDDMAGEMSESVPSASALSNRINELGDETRELPPAIFAAITALTALQAVMATTSATATGTQETIDEVGDEARESAAEVISLGGAMGFLSLESSALSINVGAFTVALRNLTTQVPLLVASLGNLAAAFTGLAAAVSGVGLGAFALALGGMLAKAEQLSGPLEGAGNTMEALGQIANEMKYLFIDAIQPLLETEGVIDVFYNTMEGIANIVHSTAETIQYVFEESFQNIDGTQLQSLAVTMDQIGEAVMSNIDEINNAIGDMIVMLGDDIARLTEVLAEGLPDFIRRVTVITEEMIDIFGAATDHLGHFTSELMELGRAVGAGLAPVLDTFFQVVGTIVEELNALGAETIAAAVAAGTMILAVNRLAGVVGSLVQPLTAAASSIGILAARSQSFGDAFLRVFEGVLGNLSNLENGIGRLTAAFGTLFGAVGMNTSIIHSLRTALYSSDDAASLLSRSFGILSIQSLGLKTAVLSLTGSLMQAAGGSSTLTAVLTPLNKSLVGSISLSTALSRSLAALTGVQTMASLSATAYAAATSLAATATTALLTAAGALVGVIGVLAIVVGTAGAVLASLAASGSNVSNIVAGLRTTFERLASATMPFVIASSEMMLDIFNSLMAPIRAITNGITDMAATLGLVGDSGGGLVGLYESFIGLITPVLGLIGDLARVIGTVLTQSIQTAFGILNAALGAVVGVFSYINDLIGGFIAGLTGASGEGLSLVDILVRGVTSIIDGISTLMDIIGTLFSTLVSLSSVFTSVFGAMFDLVTDIATFLGTMMVSAFRGLGSIIRSIGSLILSAFGTNFNEVTDSFMSFVNTVLNGARSIYNSLTSIPREFVETWNDSIGGFKLTVGDKVVADIPKLDVPNEKPTIPASTVSQSDLESGAGVASGFVGEAQEAVTPGRSPNVTVDEGDTTNIFNQDIKADPEDKGQIGRIAKDAMEEANSFKRRQEGSQ